MTVLTDSLKPLPDQRKLLGEEGLGLVEGWFWKVRRREPPDFPTLRTGNQSGSVRSVTD
jgi:hypothetical protein